MNGDGRTRVFAYGTLTDPERLERVLGDRRGSVADSSVDYEVLGPATLEGLRRVDGTYPTLVPGDEVEGMLLAIDGAGLERLDAYEGVDRGLYVRVRVRLSESGTDRVDDGRDEAPEDNRSGDTWVYVGDPDRLGVDLDAWPGSGSFEDRVERLLERARIVITPRE